MEDIATKKEEDKKKEKEKKEEKKKVKDVYGGRERLGKW
jgi:hypothetical protein